MHFLVFIHVYWGPGLIVKEDTLLGGMTTETHRPRESLNGCFQSTTWLNIFHMRQSLPYATEKVHVLLKRGKYTEEFWAKDRD